MGGAARQLRAITTVRPPHNLIPVEIQDYSQTLLMCTIYGVINDHEIVNMKTYKSANLYT